MTTEIHRGDIVIIRTTNRKATFETFKKGIEGRPIDGIRFIMVDEDTSILGVIKGKGDGVTVQMEEKEYPKCPRCKGAGRIFKGKATCPLCDGERVVKRMRER